MIYEINPYIAFLDSVIAECNSVPSLMPKSNAVTRRAKATYQEERDALRRLADRAKVTAVTQEVYDTLWPKLCKNLKYGILCESYAKPKEPAHDMRYPQDGRVVPGYAKDVLAQLRTLAQCVLVMSKAKTAEPVAQ